jgi:hypothetical protein
MNVTKFEDVVTLDRKEIHQYLSNLTKPYVNKVFKVVQLGASVGGTPDPARGDWCPTISDPVWKLLFDNKNWRGYLFEPHIPSFLKCCEFYKHHKDRVSILPCAVSKNLNPFVSFNIRNAATMSSLNSFHRKESEVAGRINDTKLIPNLNINAIILQIQPDWLQIDIEGEDGNVVEEMLKLEDDKLPLILSFEWCLEKPERMKDLCDKLYKRGYSCEFISHWDVIFSKTKNKKNI